MKGIVITLMAAMLLGSFGGAGAKGEVKVVATTLDVADFVGRIGGDRIDVYAIFRGRTDLHFFEPIPSQVMKLQRADALVVVGLDADAWARALIDASRNPRILFGASGYIDPSDGIRPIQVPEGRIDGSMGHVHPYGNPHYWFTLENMMIVTNNICDGLARVSPQDREYFAANRDAYGAEIERTFTELQEMLAPYRGTCVIEYHSSWDYFCNQFGLEVAATLEPKPGIPPSAKHLSEVVRIAKAKGARLMLAEPYYPDKPIRYVQRETGIPALRLPIYLGSVEGIETYLDLLRYNVHSIRKALGGE